MRLRKKTEIRRVTPTNDAQFTRLLDCIEESDLGFKTYQTEKESAHRIMSYASPKTD